MLQATEHLRRIDPVRGPVVRSWVAWAAYRAAAGSLDHSVTEAASGHSAAAAEADPRPQAVDHLDKTDPGRGH